MERTTRGGPPGGPGGAGGPGGGRGGRGGPGGPGGFGGGRGGPGGFGGGGRGGPGGGRGGPGGRDGDRRGPRRDDFGSRSDSLALDAARALDKPVLAADFAAQLPVLEALALNLQRARVRSPEAFGDDARGKLLTALLRVMHQRKVEDAEKEVLRRKVQATLGEVFRAVGDERRAGLCLAEAGEAKAAAHLLAHTGEWDAVAAAHERDGQFADAAKLYASHARPLDEARLREKAGEHERALQLYLEAGAQEDAARAAKALPLPRAKVLLLQLGAGDLLLDRLAKEGRYEEVARLYERAEQWGDAGRAYEAAGRTFKAIACFDRAALAPEADRLIAAEAARKLGNGDKVGAAAVWARFGRWAIAAREAPDPVHAHAWLVDAGERDRANELARLQAEKATAEGLLAEAAVWRERAGDLVAAAEAFAQGGKPGEGARCWELLHEWARAAPLWLEAGDRARAAELFARAGDHERAIGILKGG